MTIVHIRSLTVHSRIGGDMNACTLVAGDRNDIQNTSSFDRAHLPGALVHLVPLASLRELCREWYVVSRDTLVSEFLS